MNIHDKEFILSVLDEYEVAIMTFYDPPKQAIENLAKARTILQRQYYKEDSEGDVILRHRALNFNDDTYHDWHHDPSLLDEESDED